MDDVRSRFIQHPRHRVVVPGNPVAGSQLLGHEDFAIAHPDHFRPVAGFANLLDVCVRDLSTADDSYLERHERRIP